jgi:AAA15 family ATPase/GTPase
MLLRFAVSNQLSIKDKQELSFIKSALKGPEEGLLSTPALPKHKVLPAAIIYGPNASGKSNLLEALNLMRNAVLYSQSRWEPDSGVPWQPFLLNQACKEKPSFFEIEFDIKGVKYNYGFATTKREFVEEWLYFAPVGHQRLIFERSGPNPEDIKFGPSFTGQKQAIAQLMRNNSLFLSAAFQNNHPLAKTIVSIFQKIRSHNIMATGPAMLDSFLKDRKLDNRILTFLKQVGTGIVNYKQVENLRPEEVASRLRSLTDVLFEGLSGKEIDDERQAFLDDIDKEVKIEFAHQSEEGDEVFFEAALESTGTRRLIPLLQSVMLSLDQGDVLVVDEIDASLHTQICEAIIALFTNRETNPNGAQIIATTHDTNLLNAPNLRRDELWLVEKSPGGASEFYSLADIKTRDNNNFERGYLQGRYGAVPFSGSAVELVKGL